MVIPIPIPASQVAIFLIEIAGVLIVGFIATRQLKERKVRISRMWLLPLFMFLISYAGIQNDLFDSASSAVIIGLAFVIGLALGGLRGAMIKMRIDQKQGALFVKGTPVSVVMWVALLALKGIADVGFSAAGLKGETAGIAEGIITAALLALTLGATIATRIYYYWRYSLAVSV